MYYATPRIQRSLEVLPLANTRAAEKAMRQSRRRRARNRVIRSAARTQIKQAVGIIASGDVAASDQAVREAIRALDKAAEKGVLKKNNASRRKSRLMKKLNRARAAQKPA
jgi:small subunit ribosomal protein S20